jgi:glycosyltransferase involved in cell wall biosynthesis
MPAMYSLFNVFVHVPINKYHEAFGQVYIEVMASKIPSIVTISGVANDFVENKKNALVVDYKSSGQIYDSLIYAKEHPGEMQRLTQQALLDIKVFDEVVCAEKLKNDYLRLL